MIDIFNKSKSIITETIRNSITFSAIKKIDQICHPLKDLGISGFFYMRVFPDGTFIDLLNSQSSSWSKHYFTQFYQGNYDAASLKKHMLNTFSYVYWDAFPKNIIWQESVKFGFCHGISINCPSKNYTEVYSFFSSVSSEKSCTLYLENPVILKQFIGNFLIYSDDLIQQANKRRWVTPKIYQNTNNTNIDKKTHLAKNFLEKIKANGFFLIDEKGVFKLTMRETKILLLLSKGYSSKELARQLNISYRTVESHLENIRMKLGYTKISKIISLATKQGINEIAPYLFDVE